MKLQQGKYYIGITSKSPNERLEEHTLGKRAAYWTMKYKPIEIELYEDLGVVSKQHAEQYENKVTRSLMRERGLNNVRGGDLRSVDNYIHRFGYVWDMFTWEAITLITLQFLVILYLLIDKYILHL